MGVGAWTAGIFHFMTHAFFKSLLFLAAGVVIQAMHEEHSIFKMGGLRKELPLGFWCFPDRGLFSRRTAAHHCGLLQQRVNRVGDVGLPTGQYGSVVCGRGWRPADRALHLPRYFSCVLWRGQGAEWLKRPGYKIQIPLVVLTVLSLVGGFVNLPPELGNVPLFTRLLDSALPPVEQGHFGPLTEMRSEGFVTLAFLIGLGLAYLFYLRSRQWSDALTATRDGKSAARVLVCRLGIRLVLRQTVRAARPVVCAGR